MRRRRSWLVVVMLATTIVAGCGEGQEQEPAAERLSRGEAIARLDALCRHTYAQVNAAGPEPSVAAGTTGALDRYERWQQRVLASTAAGLRRIEQVQIPSDARAKEIEAYVFWGREMVAVSHKLLAAVRTGDTDEAERQGWARDSAVDQAGYAAKRYGLTECGA